jgi:serine/threonine-protein kinase
LLAAMPAANDQKTFLRCCADIFPSETAQDTPAAPVRPNFLAPATLDPATIAELTATFAAFIGPLARVLVDRAITKAGSPAKLLDLLASEIASKNDRERFLRTVPPALRRDP